jgi:hypothetical protein
LGALAPNEGEPVLYTWRWYYSATGLGLWVVLILAMALPKANRTPRTLLILIPLAVAYLGWLAFRAAMGGNEHDNILFGIMICTLAVGSAVLWLLAHRLAAGRWYKTLLAATGVVLGVALVGGLSLGVESDEMILAMVLIGMMLIATVLGYALAVWGYRTRRAWRFLVFQAVGTIGASFVGALLMTLIVAFIIQDGPDNVAQFLMGMVLAGLVVGFVVFLIALPFAVLGLSSPFFRWRLLLCLPPQGISSSNDPHDSASMATET